MASDAVIERAPLVSAEGLRRCERLYAAAERLASDLIDVPAGASDIVVLVAAVKASNAAAEVLNYKDLVEVEDWIVAKGLVPREHKPLLVLPPIAWAAERGRSTWACWLRLVDQGTSDVLAGLFHKGRGGATLDMVPHWLEPLRREAFVVTSALTQEILARRAIDAMPDDGLQDAPTKAQADKAARLVKLRKLLADPEWCKKTRKDQAGDLEVTEGVLRRYVREMRKGDAPGD